MLIGNRDDLRLAIELLSRHGDGAVSLIEPHVGSAIRRHDMREFVAWRASSTLSP